MSDADLDDEARAIYDHTLRTLGNVTEKDKEDIKDILRIAERMVKEKKKLND
jgi:hypothetical protein